MSTCKPFENSSHGLTATCEVEIKYKMDNANGDRNTIYDIQTMKKESNQIREQHGITSADVDNRSFPNCPISSQG